LEKAIISTVKSEVHLVASEIVRKMQKFDLEKKLISMIHNHLRRKIFYYFELIILTIFYFSLILNILNFFNLK